MNSLYIESTGKYIPPKIVTNDDLSKIVDTSDDWIYPRTGIKRRHVNEELTCSEMGARAAREALENGGTDPDDLCCLILATASPDTFEPANACAVHGMLGLPEHVLSFDVFAACPGFTVSLNVARGMLLQNPGKKALVVASENSSSYIDWTDRSTCVLFGDGAGAAVVSLQDDGETYFEDGTCDGFDAIQVSADPAAGDDFRVMRMKGQEVFRFAVRTIPEVVTRLLDRAGLGLDDIDHFVFHQANMRIIRNVCKKMGIPEDKCFCNIEEYGNTSAASSAIVLAEMNEQGLLERGDKVLVVCFGAGLTYEGILFDW